MQMMNDLLLSINNGVSQILIIMFCFSFSLIKMIIMFIEN